MSRLYTFSSIAIAALPLCQGFYARREKAWLSPKVGYCFQTAVERTAKDTKYYCDDSTILSWEGIYLIFVQLTSVTESSRFFFEYWGQHTLKEGNAD
jgi:hypothetical protein